MYFGVRVNFEGMREDNWFFALFAKGWSGCWALSDTFLNTDRRSLVKPTGWEKNNHLGNLICKTENREMPPQLLLCETISLLGHWARGTWLLASRLSQPDPARHPFEQEPSPVSGSKTYGVFVSESGSALGRAGRPKAPALKEIFVSVYSSCTFS